ncbi:MAG: NUDIX hydrolase [Clostridia bacterium]|nr:NUDIX hydrolase [Clostridia bacterium]
MTDYSELREIPFEKETIYEGAILHVEKWQVTCPNGHAAPREIVVHKGAAAVVPVYEDGTTLLVRQHRVSVDRVTLEIPAGKLDSAQEDPLECAVRELREETGLRAEKMTLLTSMLTTPGFCTEKIGIYLAQGLTEGDMHPDEDEFLGVVRMPLDEAVAMVMRGELRDSKTICGLLMARDVIRAQREQA